MIIKNTEEGQKKIYCSAQFDSDIDRGVLI